MNHVVDSRGDAMKTAKQLLIEGLEAMGADGLVNTNVGDPACGCGFDMLGDCGYIDLCECKPAKLNQKDGLYYLMEEQ